MTELVLASTSPYRRALLARLGLEFRCAPPGVDEEAVKVLGLAPEELARRLAHAKARAVAGREPRAVVIGSDQVCALGDEVLDKPGNRATAIERLSRLAGREHRLVTAVCVAADERQVEFVDVTRLWVRPLARAEIERYVDRDRPFDVAGGYKLEALGVALFERIESRDQTAIVGLPLIELCGVLREMGFRLP